MQRPPLGLDFRPTACCVGANTWHQLQQITGCSSINILKSNEYSSVPLIYIVIAQFSQYQAIQHYTLPYSSCPKFNISIIQYHNIVCHCKIQCSTTPNNTKQYNITKRRTLSAHCEILHRMHHLWECNTKFGQWHDKDAKCEAFL